jgi:Mg/Co/Ni transporter MgtE
VALLQTRDVAQAGEALGELPFELQQSLFRHLPLDLATTIVPHFPYYHQYVLMHSLPVEEMRALVDKIHPSDRMHFFDQLPEEAWQRFVGSRSVLRRKNAGAKQNRATTHHTFFWEVCS